jgi:hypothetical protein
MCVKGEVFVAAFMSWGPTHEVIAALGRLDSLVRNMLHLCRQDVGELRENRRSI